MSKYKHHMNPKTSYCFDDCEACKDNAWMELKIFGFCLILVALFLMFVKSK